MSSVVLFGILCFMNCGVNSDDNLLNPENSDLEARLSALTTSSGDVTPAFNPDAIIYSLIVANSVDTLTVTATSVASGATISVVGPGLPEGGVFVDTGVASPMMQLAVGKNNIIIYVRSRNKEFTFRYFLTVTRAAS